MKKGNSQMTWIIVLLVVLIILILIGFGIVGVTLNGDVLLK